MQEADEDAAFARELLAELEADEFCLVMRQAKRYRADTLAAIRARKRDPWTCPTCYTYRDPVLVTAEGDSVCTGCGLVLEHHLVGDSFGDRARCKRYHYPGYKHVFHFNERVANLACDDPTIPPDVFELVEMAYWDDSQRRGSSDLWYDDVRRILRSVEVPYEVREKYRGKRYKMLPLTDLDQKFSERWLTIRYRLTGKGPPDVPPCVRRGIQVLFLGILPPFSYIRHRPGCDGRGKCHKQFGCSYKLPPYNFIIKELLYVFGGRDLMEAYSPYLLHTTSTSSLNKIRMLWDRICEANGWVASYHPNADERRPTNLCREV
jgi:hypothetical protein